MLFLKNLPRLLKIPVVTRNFSQVQQVYRNVSAPIAIPQSATNNNWIWQQNDKIKLPVVKRTNIQLPNGLIWVPLEEPLGNREEIGLPPHEGQDESKEAVRMIVIRRRKMRRHKLKKLRKKMKFEWARKRLHRELQKEKKFQAELIKQCKDGEAFSAEKYVEEKIALYTESLKNLDLSHTSRK